MLENIMPTNIKFFNPKITASGKKRAYVNLNNLKTLWFNTGTLCNLSCENCYIESTPKNDRLVYLSLDEVTQYLNEITYENYKLDEIGITGGEPFMNPDIIKIIEEILIRGHNLLVLTNAMRPMMKLKKEFLYLNKSYNKQISIRVSIDHFKQELHEEERGANSWLPMIKGMKWLSDNEFNIDVAGRTRWGDNEIKLRTGFQEFFKQNNININAHDNKQLILFPEMDENIDVPEITTDCWGILGVNIDDMMCASSRMIVKRRGDNKPSVQACTLLAYDQQFNMGHSLKESLKPVYLNHPHCAKFCVLGGGSCSISD